MNRPNPNHNPTLEGYEILAASLEVEGPCPDTTARALVVRYSDHPDEPAHIIWQEKSKDSDEWRYQPGQNATTCGAVIMALLGIK